MSQEIIYTSAPQGLKLGSRGFCTVASTAGMAKPLAEYMESLSGYRHLFPPGDPNAHLNPICYSHLLITVSGQRFHLLSRIADAGLDYSQRTNKLAHHVALTTAELVAPGPAWVISQPGFMETSFSGEPRLLGAGRRAPVGVASPSVCHAWERLTGDAGWGGVLAENITDSPNGEAYLIYRSGMEILPLLVEAQLLLPQEVRWQATFSTYYTKLPPGAQCRWKCVVAGTPEAVAALRARGSLVLDLTSPLGRSPNTAWAQAARTGVTRRISGTVGLPATHAGTNDLGFAPEPATRPSSRPLRGDELELVASPPPLKDAYAVEGQGLDDDLIYTTIRPLPPRGANALFYQSRRRWPMVVAAIGLLVLLGVAVGAALLWTKSTTDIATPTAKPAETIDTAAAPAKVNSEAAPQSIPAQPNGNATKGNSEAEGHSTAPSGETTEVSPTEHPKSGASEPVAIPDSEKSSEKEVQRPTAEEPKQTSPDPRMFDNLKMDVELPRLRVSQAVGGESSAQPEELLIGNIANLFYECQLIKSTAPSFSLLRTKDEVDVWQVVPIHKQSPDSAIGEFSQKEDKSFCFNWKPGATDKDRSELQSHLLLIRSTQYPAIHKIIQLRNIRTARVAITDQRLETVEGFITSVPCWDTSQLRITQIKIGGKDQNPLKEKLFKQRSVLFGAGNCLRLTLDISTLSKESFTVVPTLEIQSALRNKDWNAFPGRILTQWRKQKKKFDDDPIRKMKELRKGELETKIKDEKDMMKRTQLESELADVTSDIAKIKDTLLGKILDAYPHIEEVESLVGTEVGFVVEEQLQSTDENMLSLAVPVLIVEDSGK